MVDSPNNSKFCMVFPRCCLVSFSVYHVHTTINICYHMKLVHHQLYGNHTQLYKSCCPSEFQSTIKDIEDFVTDIKSWMKSNKLQMNDDKTGTVLISSNQLSKFHLMPCSIQINGNSIQFSQHFRNLSILIDSSLSHFTNKSTTYAELHIQN